MWRRGWFFLSCQEHEETSVEPLILAHECPEDAPLAQGGMPVGMDAAA